MPIVAAHIPVHTQRVLPNFHGRSGGKTDAGSATCAAKLGRSASCVPWRNVKLPDLIRREWRLQVCHGEIEHVRELPSASV